MIIVRIIGGVGNQLFQYAAAKACAIRLNTDLKLDLTEYDTYKLRNYELNQFHIQENIASAKEIIDILKSNKILKKRYIKEKNNKFNPQILKAKDNSYLEGYFQSERYFKDIENIIKSEFTFKNTDFLDNKDILEELKNCNSVSINIRGGDYVRNPEVAKIYKTCTTEYYTKAVEYLKDHCDNLKFYVITDDKDYVLNTFKPSLEYKLLETNSWQEDFYYIQNCKHNVISNSSFAWWGAWLNNNPDKIVITPNKWFNTNKISSKNIVPQNWLKFSVK